MANKRARFRAFRKRQYSFLPQRIRVRWEDVPADQQEAIMRTQAEFHRVNSRMNEAPKDIIIPRADWLLVYAAFDDWPRENLTTGERWSGNVHFIKTALWPQEHFLFKGVACFPDETLI